jgi:hypothetical protein
VSESVDYAALRVVKMPDGDFMVTYIAYWKELKSRKAKDFDPNKHIVRKHSGFLIFASKESKFTPDDEYNNFFEKARREKRVMESFPIVFSDGSTMKRISGSTSSPFDYYFERKDKNSKSLIWKKLLYIYDKPIKKKIPMAERNFNYKGEYYYERVSWPSELQYIPLEDDTFLIIGFLQYQKPPSVIIIRFDKDLKTKSNLMNKKLFLFDEEIYQKMQRPMDDQTENKFFYEYLMKLKRGGSHGNYK